MDWKKLHSNIYAFANNHGMRTKEHDTNYFAGKFTIYQLNEGLKIFYELKHVKHSDPRGNKLTIYSNSTDQLSIKVKSRLLGKPTIKSNFDLPANLHKLLTELVNQIGAFEWSTQQHHYSWPTELANCKTLKFECKQIDAASEHLDSIRKIHLALLEKKVSDRR